MNITVNQWKGITLQNIEQDVMEKKMLKSKIAYDDHNIEMEKDKEIYHSAKGIVETIRVERLQDKPFAVKETWMPEQSKGRTVFYGMVEQERPDSLYSDYFVPRKENYRTIEDLEKNYQTKNYVNHLGELSDKNQKAAYYFISMIEGDKKTKDTKEGEK